MDEQTSVVEANGVPAPTTSAQDQPLTLNDTATSDPPHDASPNTNIVQQTRKPWQFQPGNRMNPAGRPRKGTSVLEQTQREAERKAKAIAKAAVDRMLEVSSVGNRAWADYRDTYYGVPKQTLVLEQGEDPLASLYAAIADAGGAVVEGESRVLPAPNADHSPDE